MPTNPYESPKEVNGPRFGPSLWMIAFFGAEGSIPGIVAIRLDLNSPSWFMRPDELLEWTCMATVGGVLGGVIGLTGFCMDLVRSR